MSRSVEEAARVVRAWLDAGSTDLSDRVRDRVLNEFRTTPQDGSVWSLRGHLQMNTVAKFAVTAAAVVVVSLVGVNLLSQKGAVGGPPPSVAPSPSLATTPGPSPSPSQSEVNSVSADYKIGRHSVTVEGVPFSFDIGATGWEPWAFRVVTVPPGGLHLNKSITGPQGAEGLLYWTGFPYGTYTEPCVKLWTSSVWSSTASVVSAVSTAAGTELVTGPVDVSVGGLPAKYMELRVRENLGCDPGYFHAWPSPIHGEPYAGAFWLTPGAGATLSVWILEVDGTRLFIAGETHVGDNATDQELQQLTQEIHHIVDSIQFEQ